ncbi:MAG: hypothetical protein VKK62_11520 [Synechococcaceae cyanobacterium]|nr:hypothetical protein [Synechococcaceae cyanobacterium]
MGRKQVHLLMPDELHRLVKEKADGAGVSLTAYLLSLVEADLQSEPNARNNIYGLALRVRAIEVHLGLDSRRPGQRLDPTVAEKISHAPVSTSEEAPAEDAPLRRRASDRAGDRVGDQGGLRSETSEEGSDSPPRRRASDRAADRASDRDGLRSEPSEDASDPPLRRRASDRAAADAASPAGSPQRRRASERSDD